MEAKIKADCDADPVQPPGTCCLYKAINQIRPVISDWLLYETVLALIDNVNHVLKMITGWRTDQDGICPIQDFSSGAHAWIFRIVIKSLISHFIEIIVMTLTYRSVSQNSEFQLFLGHACAILFLRTVMLSKSSPTVPLPTRPYEGLPSHSLE